MTTSTIVALIILFLIIIAYAIWDEVHRCPCPQRPLRSSKIHRPAAHVDPARPDWGPYLHIDPSQYLADHLSSDRWTFDASLSGLTSAVLSWLKQQATDGSVVHLSPGDYLNSFSLLRACAYWDVLVKFATSEGWSILRGDDPDDATNNVRGFTLPDKKQITITKGVSDSGSVYLLLHELGHAFGQYSSVPKTDDLTFEDQLALLLGQRHYAPFVRRGELEAETTAAIVLASLSLPPNFAYLAGYGDRDLLAIVYPSAKRTADRLIPLLQPIASEVPHAASL